jgi:hypothetical protein
MKISTNGLQPGQLVNKLGKFMYKHLDGAFKIENTANMCDVYVTVLYAIPREIIELYKIYDPKYSDVNEMTIDINITTYQNKIRVDTIEKTPEEKTLGFDLFPPEKLLDLNKALELVYSKVCRRIEKEFDDFEFLF